MCVNRDLVPVSYRNLLCFLLSRLDLQPMNRETVPMSEILVSDERENGWVIERGTIQISFTIHASPETM
jgi:hypothetical protein